MEKEKIQHNVNVKNMISQMANEHDLLTELVTNALEEAKSRVDVEYTTDPNDKAILIIKNNGKELTKEQIKSKLLTAFETGENKNYDTNRGLGFISIYNAMEYACIYTGNLYVQIWSWDNIQIQQSMHYTSGVQIQVTLNDKTQEKYDKIGIEELLSNWVLYGSVKIYYNDKDCTKYIPEIEGEIFCSGGEIVYDSGHFDQEFVALYKLTNVEAYRMLPISYSLQSANKNNLITDVIVVFTTSEELDTSRTAISWWGKSKLEEKIKTINRHLSIEMLNNKYISYGKKAHRLILKQIKRLTQFDLNVERAEIQMHIDLVTRISKVNTINRYLRYFNCLVDLISLTPLRKIVGMEQIALTEIFDEAVINFKLNEPEHDGFTKWFKKLFGVNQQALFMDQDIGLLVQDGDVIGTSKLFHLLDDNDYNEWIKIDQELWSKNLLKGQNIVLLFDEKYTFFSSEFPKEKSTFNLKYDSKVMVESSDEKDNFAIMRNKNQMIAEQVRKSKTDRMETDFLDENEEESFSYTPTKEEMAVVEATVHKTSELKKFTELDTKKLETSLELQRIKFEVIKAHGVEIPCLVKDNAVKKFEKMKGQPKKLKQVVHGLNIWRETVQYVIDSFGGEAELVHDYVIPVMLFTEDNMMACNVQNFIAFSVDYLPRVTDNRINKVMNFMETACHEITHLYVVGHNEKFIKLYNSIYTKVANRDDLHSRIKTIY